MRSLVISVRPSDPAFIRRIVAELADAVRVARLDIVLFDRRFDQRVEIGQADVLHVGRRKTVHRLLHAVGEDADDAEDVGTGFSQGVDDFDDAAAGGDEVFDNDDLLTGFQLPFDAVLAAVVLVPSRLPP